MRISAQIQVVAGHVRILVTEADRGDVLKASLPHSPAHPRAMLTLLEGLALWSGAPVCAVIIAEQNCPSWVGAGVFGDELWPGESQLVQYEVGNHVRPKRLRGMGDFHALRIPRSGGFR